MEPKFAALLDKYRAGTIDPDERALLAAELELPERIAELEAYIDAEFRNDGVGGLSSPPQGDAIFQRLMQEIRGGLRESKSTIPLHSPNRWRWAAAAVIVLIVGAGTYFWIKNEHKKAAIAGNVFKNDVAPGGNKAILTLSNGKQIILDSARNGMLAQQGNINIIKTDSGKLAYNIIDGKPRTEPGEVQYNVLTTPMGGQFQLTLPDGSQVWLNAASSIKYPTAFRGKERNVEITGEAYFEVSKDKSKPFHVKVNDMEVEVLGTHFNINSYSDEGSMKTTLLEGSVKLSKGKDQGTTLKPGQQAQSTAKQLIVVDDPNIEQVMAWKNGLFDFNKADLQTVMRQIGRWYDVEIVYDRGVPDMHFGGELPRDLNLSEVLDALKRTDVRFRIEGRKIIVMSK